MKKEVEQEKFEMAMTNVWMLMFGFSLGVWLMDNRFWWLPVFIILSLGVARVLLRRVKHHAKANR